MIQRVKLLDNTSIVVLQHFSLHLLHLQFLQYYKQPKIGASTVDSCKALPPGNEASLIYRCIYEYTGSVLWDGGGMQQRTLLISLVPRPRLSSPTQPGYAEAIC